MTLTTPEDVLSYWFGTPATTEDELMTKIRRWFQGGEAVDREIDERFGDTLRAALGGGLRDWTHSPRGRLALVILLDQFTRSVFRDRSQMYAGDGRAQELALQAFADGTADGLPFVEALFLAMPLLHSEDLALHDRLREISSDLGGRVQPLYEKMYAMHAEQRDKYRDIIARFGRFPHRNEILHRTSTPEEKELLLDWSEKAPPRGARPNR